MLCGCDGWLPISVGKIESFKNLEDVWQTNVAKQLQQDIDSKKFTWCSVDACGIRQENRIKQRYFISVNIDESCNLACPSCRRSKINRTSGNEYESRLLKTRHLVKLINKFDHPMEIMMSGNGDPFASLIYRPLLMEMEPKENVKIRMLTNGLLLKKLLPSMKIKQSIKRLDISIDAGDKETYEKVRLGGKWNVLIENLDYIKENVDCKVTLFFVLQKDNIDSVDNFVRLMEQYGFNGNIMPIENWGAMDNFAEHDVFASDHPMNARVKDILARYGNQPGLFFHSINKF